MKGYKVFAHLFPLLLCCDQAHSFCNIQEEGFDTDCITLDVRPSTVLSGSVGLFTRDAIKASHTICEDRGFLIPQDQHYTPSVSPLIPGLNNILYSLESNSICSFVKDCVNMALFDASSTDTPQLHEGCRYNAAYHVRHGKLFLVAITDINPDEELFANHGGEFLMLVQRHDMDWSGGRPSTNRPLPKEAIYTDFFSVFSAPTLLPYGGNGLFARYDFPQGAIICEYRGPTYRYPINFSSDKLSSLLRMNGENWVSVGDEACGLSNDAAYVHNAVMTRQEYESIQRRTSYYKNTPGFSQNSVRVSDPGSQKSFIVAQVPISAGAEIFNPFGIYYWDALGRNITIVD